MKVCSRAIQHAKFEHIHPCRSPDKIERYIAHCFSKMKNSNDVSNTRFPFILRFHSALHCGYSGITDIQDGLIFVLTRSRTFKKS